MKISVIIKKKEKVDKDMELNINDSILLTIKRIGINGEGIGYYKRKAVFVENTLPGEVVEVKVTDVKDNYIEGEVIKFKTKSPKRIEAPCPYYHKCGGCQLQHLNYASQLEEKRNLLIEAFERYYDGDISKIKFNDMLGMENPWRYRNKSSLPVRHDGEKVVVGMYAKNSNHLVYIEDSLVENELISNVRRNILDILTKQNVDIYNPKTHTGSLRYLVIRGFEETKEVQVTFVLTKPDKKLINILKQLDVTSTNYSINSDPKSIEIFGETVVNVSGKPMIEGRLGELKFEISPQAFFQLNTKQIITLYDEIKKACNLTGRETVVDCYCGIGSIAMYLAKDCKEVRGIDTNKAGIEDAKRFAKMNNIDNAKFYAGNILPFLHQFKENGMIPDILIVDPPRKGLDANLIEYLKNSKIQKIVYVSCNPATLAKNVNHMKKEYKVNYVTPIDLFPQTSHVECVVLMSRK